MAIALVSSCSGATNSSSATSSSMNTTGANLIVVSASWYTSAGGCTITDSKGNTWTALNLADCIGVRGTRLWYCHNPTVGSGHTFTATAANPAVTAMAFSGVNASPFDKQATNIQNNTAILVGSVTPSENGELLVTTIAHDSASASANNGFSSSVNVPFSSGVNVALSMAYLVQTTASAVNVLWTPTVGGFLATVIGTFKASSFVPNPYYYLHHIGQRV